MARVLVVDDDDSVRLLVRLMLETDPSLEIVGEASNGREAVERVQELAPELVVMDLTMPIMDGVEATRRIKQSRPGIDVVAFTSTTEHTVIDAVLAAGALIKVDKDPERLLDVLHELASTRQVAAADALVPVPLPAERRGLLVALGAPLLAVARAARTTGQLVRSVRPRGGLTPLAGATLMVLALFLAGTQPNGPGGMGAQGPGSIWPPDRGIPKLVWSDSGSQPAKGKAETDRRRRSSEILVAATAAIRRKGSSTKPEAAAPTRARKPTTPDDSSTTRSGSRSRASGDRMPAHHRPAVVAVKRWKGRPGGTRAGAGSKHGGVSHAEESHARAGGKGVRAARVGRALWRWLRRGP